jgi:lysophospholipase L1-like esterase
MKKAPLPMHSTLLRGTLAVTAVLFTVACGGSSPTQPTPVAPPPALSLTCPNDIALESTDGNPVTVTVPAVTRTGGTEPVTVQCDAPQGNVFPVGATRVTCRASDTALQQASCTYTVTVTRQPQLHRVHFMAFGDSITQGVVSDPIAGVLATDGFPAFILQLRPNASYPTRLLARLQERYVAQERQLRVSNLGIGGERVEDGVDRLDQALRVERPEALLLLHGANNMGGPFPSSRSYIIQHLGRMMQDGRFRGARVFVATMPPPRPAGGKALPLSAVLDLNHHIRLTAQGEGAVLVDIYGALATDVNRYMGIDGLHPTEAGYQRMADEFFEAIKRDLERR